MSVNITLYNVSNIDELDWLTDQHCLPFRNYLEKLVKNEIKSFISNAEGRIELLKVDNTIVPISINEYKKNTTFICSLYSQYISYAIEELDKINNRLLQACFHMILKCMGVLAKSARMDKTIQINNWLFPTNLHPTFSQKQIAAITDFLVERFPEHALIVRTLNHVSDFELIKNLRATQFQLLGSRQIYLLGPERYSEFKKKKPKIFRRDHKLLEQEGIEIKDYTLRSNQIENDICKFYYDVYIKHHSVLNPVYTRQFFSIIQQTPGFSLKLIYDKEQLIGFMGYLRKNNIIYTPLLGYHANVVKEKGVYRMISALKLQAAEKHNSLVHSSAGAATFKRNRGHEVVTEYHAYYIKHLSLKRKMIWKFIQSVVNYLAVPFIKKQGL